VAQATGKDWSAALANMQAATLREDCRPEIASSSEASEGGVSEPPNPDRKGEGSHNRGMSHQANSVIATLSRANSSSPASFLLRLSSVSDFAGNSARLTSSPARPASRAELSPCSR
jgi:hypothetical protein